MTQPCPSPCKNECIACARSREGLDLPAIDVTDPRFGARLVAGSATCADETRRRMIAHTRLKLIPRGIAGFAPLAAQAGFRIAKAQSALLSEQVLLRAR